MRGGAAGALGKAGAPRPPDGQLKPILAYSSDKLVSSDFNHVPASCSFDATQTAAIDGGKLIRICGWYDNEWGFSNRMADTAAAFGAV